MTGAPEPVTDSTGETVPLTYRPRPVGKVVAAAVVGVGAVWFALSILTGLIFHFMPAAPIVVAVWLERSYGPDRPLAWRALSAHIAGGVAVSVTVWAALGSIGASLDAAWQVVAVMLAGIGVATWLGRRGAS